MRIDRNLPSLLPRQAAIAVLAAAIGVPVWAQQPAPQAPPASADSSVSQNAVPTSQNDQQAADQQNSDQNAASTTQAPPAREGFWGRINPMARKKWVKKQIDPINDRLNELDQVNARNAEEIKDVDARAQAGIHQAQSAAEAAQQTANSANQEAQNASNAAQQASNHVNQIDGTVKGIDQYHQVTDFEVKFRPGTSILTEESKQDLDKLAVSLTGRDGYVLEMEAQAPGNGSIGIQSSQRLAEAVERYLVTDHQIPIYRMHSVALGNMEVASNEQSSNGEENARPAHVRTRVVHVQLMENSLAAQGSASPQGAESSNGSVQP